MKLKKYFVIIKTAWQRAMTYRFSVYMYRIGELFWTLALVLMWSLIYSENQIIRGYTYDEMISYLLVGSLIDVMVRNWLSGTIGEDIKNGSLSMFLIKPIRYLNYIFAREIGKLSFAFFASVLTQAIVIMIFFDKLIINLDPKYMVIIFLMIILAFIIELMISFLAGLAAFWIDEINGVYYSIEKVKNIFAGQIFPLALLPSIFVKISLFLPFAYSFFIPAQLYIKKFDLQTGVYGLLVQVVWIVLLYFIIQLVWKRGIKKYEGVGI